MAFSLNNVLLVFQEEDLLYLALLLKKKSDKSMAYELDSLLRKAEYY